MPDYMSWLEKAFGKYPFSVIFTNLWAIAFGIIIVWLCFRVSDEPQNQIFNLLLAMIGALLGWALGMFFAPYDEKETARFSSIGQSVSAFASGYVLSKLDRFLEVSMFASDKLPITITWVRIGLLFSALLVAMLLVFSNRAYFRASDETKSS
ncbi:MAG: hypothetical protein ABIN99_00990 [Nitrosospira sp.]